MDRTKKNFNTYFENKDLSQSELFSGSVVKSLVRSILEPIASNNQKAIAFVRLKNILEANGLIKRLEYSSLVTLVEFTDFDFSKYDVDELGIIVLSSARYNCAFLFREVKKDKYEIHLKMNSKLVSNVYETLKAVFSIDYDEEFYRYKPERRDNDLMNDAVKNILKHFEGIIEEHEYNTKIQENKEENTSKDEIYREFRSIAHEIKNQLSVIDIYSKVIERKTENKDDVSPIRNSINAIKTQLEQFKNIGEVNLQEKNIKNVINESIKLYAKILKEKNNKIVFIDELAGIETNAFIDENKFSATVNNIIQNANDITSNDEITVKLKAKDGKIQLTITNHGEPIKKENQNKIFDSGFSTKKDGWGEGLANCKKYIEAQFGSLELIKSDKESTEFSITLPFSAE